MPGASSPEGGIEELRLLRDCRCSSAASFAVSVELAADQFLDPCGLLAQQRGHRDHRVVNHQAQACDTR